MRTDREHGNRIFFVGTLGQNLTIIKKYVIIKKKTFLPTGPRLSGKIYRIWPIAFNRKKIHMRRTDRKLGLARSRPALSTGSEAIWGCVARSPSHRGIEQMFGTMRTNVRILGKIWKRAFIIYLQKIFLKGLTFVKFRLIRPLSAGHILGTCRKCF